MKKKELFENFQKNWGRFLSPFEIDEINVLLEQDKFTPEIINEALRQSVLYNKQNMPYIIKILKNWKSRNILTVDSVRAHEEARDAERNLKVEVSDSFIEMLIGAAEIWGSDEVKEHVIPDLKSQLANT